MREEVAALPVHLFPQQKWLATLSAWLAVAVNPSVP
jgi:hypothetical protein